MSVCLFVSTAIISAKGSATVLRPVSLGAVGLKVCVVKKFFSKSDQWPSY